MATTTIQSGSDAPSAMTHTAVVMTNSARLSLGQVVATPGALTLLAETGFSAIALLARHLHGDWGDLCAEDRDSNETALKLGFRILSSYRLVDAERLAATPVHKRNELPTVWIITEADRSATTTLLPSEY